MAKDYKIVLLTSEPNAFEALRSVAELHCECLPESMITLMGRRGANLVYRFFCDSTREQILAAIDSRGIVIGGAVISTSPATLPQRLALTPKLLPFVIFAVLRIYWKKYFASNLEIDQKSNSSTKNDDTEIISLMVHSDERRNHVGKNLVEYFCQIESSTRKKTICVLAPAGSEGTVAFYARLGFIEKELVTSRGQLLKRMVYET
jgi:hypothetical protein